MDAREARLLALSTRLEQIDGGLRHLQQQVDAQWPSSEATDAAVAEAIEPLNEALDQIDRLLDAGRLRAIVHDGEWFHVGTPEGLHATTERLDSHRVER